MCCLMRATRSPTVLLAWMGTRGFGLMDAIEQVDQVRAPQTTRRANLTAIAGLSRQGGMGCGVQEDP